MTNVIGQSLSQDDHFTGHGNELGHHGVTKVIFFNGSRNANLPLMAIAANQLGLIMGAKVVVAKADILIKHEIR